MTLKKYSVLKGTVVDYLREATEGRDLTRVANG